MTFTANTLAAKQVDVGHILSQVNAMWSEAANPEGESPVMRACVLNLVGYVQSEQEAAAVNEVFAQIVGRHPSRLILMVADRQAAGSGLEAWVSAACQLPQASGRQICCEAITLVGHGSAADELHTTVLSILAPEVPMVLYWRAEPDLHSSMFEELVQTADVALLDSALFKNPFVKWRELRAHFPDAVFGDMNWARIRPWRELVAQFFDPPDALPRLQEIRRVRLEYSAQGESRIPTQALLLLGWLATRLGWKLDAVQQVEPGNYDLALKHNGDVIQAQIRSQEAGYARTGRLLGCTLETAAGGGGPEARCEFAVTRQVREDLIHTRVQVQGRQEIMHATSLEIRQEQDLIAVELDRVGRNPILDAALAFCADMCDKI